MSKKVYKKNKKVVEKVIYQRKYSKKKLNPSIFFLFVIIFFVSAALYYFNIFFLFNNTAALTMHGIFEQISMVNATPNFVPFSPNWQQALLSKKNATTASVQPKKVIAKKETNETNQIIWHGPRDKKEIALTFDADMTPVMVDWLHDGQVQSYDDTRVTNYLIQNGIKATFFLTGLWIESYPDATKQLADNALFELENHTYSHPSMAGNCFDQPQIPVSQYPFEIEKTQQLIEQYTHQTPKYFRFPGGCYNSSDLALVKKEGLQTVHWDDVANDGFNSNEDQVINNVLSEVKNGSIIVMHIGGTPNTPVTANALPIIIASLKKKGFSFVTVSELLNPPQVVARITPTQYLASLKSFQTLSL